jgi:hypothetical protein
MSALNLDLKKILHDGLHRSSSYVLIATNLVPLFGALFMGWQVKDIILLYWLETLIIGLFNVFKMLFARKEAEFKGKITLTPFFCFHYGFFVVSYAQLLAYIFSWNIFTEEKVFTGLITLLQHTHLDVGLFILLLSHGYSFITNYWKDERKNTSLIALMFLPYKRVLILHVVIIAGGLLSSALSGGNLWFLFLAIFVLMKTAVDLIFHLFERRNSAN